MIYISGLKCFQLYSNVNAEAEQLSSATNSWAVCDILSLWKDTKH